MEDQYIDATRMPNGLRALGCRPRQSEPGSFCGFFDEHFKAIPRSDWAEYSENDVSVEQLIRDVYNQGNEGTCTANGGAQAFCITTVMQYGDKAHMKMSPISTYKFCARGPNTGSSVDCIARRMRDNGLLPVDNSRNRQILTTAGLNPDHVLKATGYYQRFPSGWEETAKHFRIDEMYEVRSYEEFISALFYDFAVLYGRAGHAICGTKPKRRTGRWGSNYVNSWGNWGAASEDNPDLTYGIGWDSESFLSRSIRAYGAIAFRSTVLSDKILNALLEGDL
jgi:hypothetical protein